MTAARADAASPDAEHADPTRPPNAPVLADVALGSNLGDRAAHLAGARAAIGGLPGTRLVAASRVEETAPVGPVAQGPYLNQMLRVETALAPLALLDALLAAERAAGRVRAERWGPRTLDCDVVRYGGRAVTHPRLTLPHPELARRDWWLRELAELDAALGARSSVPLGTAGAAA